MEEPITVQYSSSLGFKGARIHIQYLEEGIKRVKKDKIKDVCIWQELDRARYTLNLDFLNGLEFLETFEWLVKLSKKSDIEGLYSLSKLRDFRWAPDNLFPIDFSRLTTIESINTRYHEGLKNLDKLTELKELYLQSVHTEDLRFLPKLDKLELLRIINGKFTSLEGLEQCSNLKKLDLRRCFNLVYAHSTLLKLRRLESVVLDSKKHDIVEDELKSRVPLVYFG